MPELSQHLRVLAIFKLVAIEALCAGGLLGGLILILKPVSRSASDVVNLWGDVLLFAALSVAALRELVKQRALPRGE